MGTYKIHSLFASFSLSLFLIILFFSPTNTYLYSDDLKIDILFRKAEALNQQGLYEKAKFLYSSLLNNSALPLSQRADALIALGTIFWNEGDLVNSARSYKDALSVSKKAGNIAVSSRSQYFLDILNIYQEAKDFMNRGEHAASISFFRKAIEYSLKANSADHEIKPSRLLSLIYWSDQDYASYRSLNSRALNLAIQTNNRREQGNTHNNLGLYYWKFDNFSRALAHLQSAASIAKEIGHIKLLNESLSNQAIVYKDLGDLNTALSIALESLQLNKKEGLNNQVAIDYLNIGVIYRQRALLNSRAEDLDKAALFFSSALEYAIADKNISLRIGILNSIGNLYADKKEYEKARTNFLNAKNLALAIEDKESLGQILNNLGLVETNLGNYEVAAAHFQEAIDIAQQLGSGQVLWEAHFELGNTYYKQARYFEALRSYKTAISIIENIRSSLRLEEYRASYLGSDKRIDTYYNIIRLLLVLNNIEPSKSFDKEAFNYLERAKARAFLDSLEIAELKFDGSADIRLINKERELMGGISGIYTKLLNPGLSEREKIDFEDKIKGFEQELESLKQEIREASPAYANLKYPEIITFNDIRRVSSRTDTTLIAFAIGKEASLAFSITAGHLTTYMIPPRLILHQQVSEYKRVLSDSSSSNFRRGFDLYKELIAPGVNKHTKRIIIIPDDILHLLPFEALNTEVDTIRWLIEDYSISYSPSLSSLKYLIDRQADRKNPHKDILAFGDPYYGPDEESPPDLTTHTFYELFSSAAINSKRLRFSGHEVSEISALFKKSRVDLFVRRAAKEEQIKAISLKDYRVIHFASHALIDDKKPSRSAILLSYDDDPAEDGLLQTREIYSMNIAANLVTLSSCQTGLGQFIRGEGIEGLNRAFFYAGASSVLISLWAVNDQATSQLMVNFYRSLKASKTPIQALRVAKLEMIRSKVSSHPFFWASFIITGNTGIRIFRF